MSDDPLRIPTCVGQAVDGDNCIRGMSVARDLAGRHGFWSCIALAVGHAPLSADEAAVLDDIATCGLAPDPRIWPLKAARLASSYGDIVAGLTVGMLSLHRALIGPEVAADAAALLRDWSPLAHDATALEHAIERLRTTRLLPLPGFGVPFRRSDERVEVLERCLQARRRTELPAWTLLQQVRPILDRLAATPVNIVGATAAALLDLGFDPEQIRALPIALPSILANAFEGAAQAPALLQRLPDATIHYRGPAPRSSPRAATKLRPP